MSDARLLWGQHPRHITKDIQMFGLQTPKNYNRMASSWQCCLARVG